jgi:hypothetical protein
MRDWALADYPSSILSPVCVVAWKMAAWVGTEDQVAAAGVDHPSRKSVECWWSWALTSVASLKLSCSWIMVVAVVGDGEGLKGAPPTSGACEIIEVPVEARARAGG